MTHNKPTTIEGYIKNCPEALQPVAQEMHDIIHGVLPDATQAVKWGHPAYSYETILVSFGAHKEHINLYTTPSSMRALADDLTDYTTGKSSIQFPYDTPLPKKLIEKVVAYRRQEFLEQGVTWM